MEDFYNFILYVFDLETKLNGNIGIHCEAGIGRTGTFIVCYDIFKYYNEYLSNLKNLSLDEQNNFINDLIIKLFISVRYQRMKFIQTLEQLKFIFDFILYLI